MSYDEANWIDGRGKGQIEVIGELRNRAKTLNAR